MQITSNDKTVRSNTVQVLKDFDSKTLTTRAWKGKQMVSTMPAIEKSFDSMGDDKVKLSTENEFLENKTVFFLMKNG